VRPLCLWSHWGDGCVVQHNDSNKATTRHIISPNAAASNSLRKLEFQCVTWNLVEAQLLNNALMTTTTDTSSLSSLMQLEVLILSECLLQDKHMHILSHGLGNHRSLQHLVLGMNDIGDAGIASFVDGWSQESVIRTLDWNMNKISGLGAKRLLEALPNHTPMDVLVLARNTAIGYDGLKLIGETPAGKKLTSLDLYWVANGSNMMMPPAVMPSNKPPKLHKLVKL